MIRKIATSLNCEGNQKDAVHCIYNGAFVLLHDDKKLVRHEFNDGF